MYKHHHINIRDSTLKNDSFENVLYELQNLTLKVCCLRPQESTRCKDVYTQCIRIESGFGKLKIGKKVTGLNNGEIVIIPQNKAFEIENTSKKSTLKYNCISTPTL